MTAQRLAALSDRYDLIIIGGGITGAGILREAARTGASVLMLERRDFASGTSSGSSKLVHGGLRYLQTGQWGLTLESVRERRRLLREAPGLVEPLTFLLPVYRGQRPSRALIQAGLWVYDLMAGRLSSRWLDRAQTLEREPDLAGTGLLGAMCYADARTDDTRLVQRLIEDSRKSGAVALNYVAVEDLLRDRQQRVCGVRVVDSCSGHGRDLEASMVVNATGAWARQFASATPGAPTLRPLRGSHLVFPSARLPLRHALSWLHPRDRRPVFAYPWEGAVMCGTTDLDHDARDLDAPRMSADESAYLIEALHARFPRLQLESGDALCSFAGVRPIVAGGKDRPSSESRESALWAAPGLVSVTGGKLTTFRVTARQVLRVVAKQCPLLAPGADAPTFDLPAGADASVPARLAGRLGAEVARRLTLDTPHALSPIGDTLYTRAELITAVRDEQVVHLDDLLLRRTRIGLVAPQGGAALLPEIRGIVQADLNWDDARWSQEVTRYLDHWQALHAPT